MTQLEMIPGTNRDLSLSQFFTPPELAQRVVEWALKNEGWDWVANGKCVRVLEPSAGNGALVRPLVAAGAEVVAYEIDQRYHADLLKAGAVQVYGNDFTESCDHNDDYRFDLCVMNPPYEDGMDVKFILNALQFAPRVVGIFKADIWHGVDRYDELWSQVRPTRELKLKRRWFKNPQTGKGGETNYVALELEKRSPLTAERDGSPDRVTIEWW